MTLNEWTAQKKTEILQNLAAGRPPVEGDYDEALFRDGLVKGEPQMGATRFEPDKVAFEFIFPDPLSTNTVFTVTLSPPERIVFMPVPEWVIEDVWQGGIDGSFHFESEAQRLLERFEADLRPEANERWFRAQPAKRRE